MSTFKDPGRFYKMICDDLYETLTNNEIISDLVYDIASIFSKTY